jgi:hypothetical protein
MKTGAVMAEHVASTADLVSYAGVPILRESHIHRDNDAPGVPRSAPPTAQAPKAPAVRHRNKPTQTRAKPNSCGTIAPIHEIG